MIKVTNEQELIDAPAGTVWSYMENIEKGFFIKITNADCTFIYYDSNITGYWDTGSLISNYHSAPSHLFHMETGDLSNEQLRVVNEKIRYVAELKSVTLPPLSFEDPVLKRVLKMKVI